MEQSSRRDAVISVLRRSILSGELGPGSRLSESDIARTIGVSRSPVREAIALLEQEGLVERIPNRGAFVNDIMSPRAISELASLRNLLETFALSLLGKDVTESLVAPIVAETRDMDDAASGRNWDAIAAADYRFHSGLVRLADHRHLYHTWVNVADRYWTLYLPQIHRQGRDIDNWGKNHRRIIDALLAGRPDVARMYLEFNILHSVEQLSESEPDSGNHGPASREHGLIL